MTGPYKESDFERAIEAHLLAHGWHKGDPKNFDRDLAVDWTELEAFITATQADRSDKLVQTRFSGDEVKARAAFRQSVAKLLDSQGVLRCLRVGVPVLGIDFDLATFRPEVGITPTLKAKYDANRLTVVRQLAYSKAHHNTLDVTLLINGIPVATAELKNKLTNQTVENAKAQYREDREATEHIFAKRTVVHFAVDTDEVYLTTKLDGEDTRFLPFNRGYQRGAGNPPAEPGKYKTSYLWEELWQSDNFLDLLRRFVHVEKDNDGRKVIFPRYHQWDGVRQLLADVNAHGQGRNYLIEHSAGSGKSNTIGWLAHRLALLHDDQDERVFDKVIIVTDRVALDKQLGDTVFQFDHVSGLVEKADAGGKSLAKHLTSSTARIVTTTLQKFPFVFEHLDETPTGKFAVIIDEAHSSQGGDAAKELRRALGAAAQDAAASVPDDGEDLSAEGIQNLVAASVAARGKQPNLSYFAFTATPTRRTMELFGTPAQGGTHWEPFHLYSMHQAIDEGFILDVLKYFTPYPVLWKVAVKADEEKEVDKSKATQAIVRYVSRHPKTLAEKADIIVEHCHNVVATKIAGKAKAMVVTPSRELAVLTYFAIKKAAEEKGYTDCRPLVAFSDSVSINGTDYTEAGLNAFGLAELPKRFEWTPTLDPEKDKGKTEYRILVVAEKYQTGFDQPLLHTMYVDKQLGGVRAVQTLSRLNRIHPPDKEDTFVLDFVNDAEDMRKAFEDFYETTITETTDPAELYVAHGNVTAYGVIDPTDEQAFAASFFKHGGDPKAHAKLLNHLQPAVTRFESLDEDDQKGFRSALAKFVDLYAFLSQAIAFTDERLEATFLYAKHLKLPSDHGGTLDLSGDVVLSHLRIKPGQVTNASPAQGGDVIGAESGDVAPPVAPTVEQLSAIIDDLNSRFGSELDAGDRVLLELVLGGMSGDGELIQEAKVNSKDNFLMVFSGPFEEEVMKTENSNKEFFEKFFSDEDFRAALIKGVGEEFHRRHGGDELAA
jgi:type I restriction enzyme R subunit